MRLADLARLPYCECRKRCRTPRAVQVYCLPDNYEVLDKSLDDIRHVRDPRFRSEEIASLDKWVCEYYGAVYHSVR